MGHTGGKCGSLSKLGSIRFLLSGQPLLQPVFAVNIAGDDEGDNVIAGRVEHRRGGIDQIAERQRDGEGDGQMIQIGRASCRERV